MYMYKYVANYIFITDNCKAQTNSPEALMYNTTAVTVEKWFPL